MFYMFYARFIRYYVRQTRGYECFCLTSFYYSSRWKARYAINICVFVYLYMCVCVYILSEMFGFAIGKRCILETNESYYKSRRDEFFFCTAAFSLRLIWRLRKCVRRCRSLKVIDRRWKLHGTEDVQRRFKDFSIHSLAFIRWLPPKYITKS